MITLKTICNYTLQEIFDQSAVHLLTQNEQTSKIFENLCMYKDSKGRKCAVGCFIPDEDYDKSIEGKQVYAIIGNLNKHEIKRELLKELQLIHDDKRPDEWIVELYILAEKLNLNKNKIKKFKKS